MRTISDGLYKTTDGGVTWTQIHTLVGQSHSEFDFPSENVGYTSYTGKYTR